MKLGITFKEKEEDKLYRLVFEHFCKDYDWYLVGTSKSKLVFMEKDYNNMNICFYLHGGKIHWSKKFFDNNIVKYTGNNHLGTYRNYLKLIVNEFFTSLVVGGCMRRGLGTMLTILSVLSLAVTNLSLLTEKKFRILETFLCNSIYLLV